MSSIDIKQNSWTLDTLSLLWVERELLGASFSAVLLKKSSVKMDIKQNK